MQTFRDELRETRREMHAGFAQVRAEMQTASRRSGHKWWAYSAT